MRTNDKIRMHTNLINANIERYSTKLCKRLLQESVHLFQYNLASMNLLRRDPFLVYFLVL